MAVDKTFLLDLSPEFSDVDEARIGRLVTLAEAQFPAGKWGAKADYAVALYVAHLLTIGASSGNGALKREKLGDMEREYAVGSSSASSGASSLDSTVWGAQLKLLGRTILRGPFVT